jgi:hypothetical protein
VGNNKHKDPTLFTLATRHLAIPASSASSERVLIQSDDKAQNQHETFSDLVIIRENAALLMEKHRKVVVNNGKDVFVLPCVCNENKAV